MSEQKPNDRQGVLQSIKSAYEVVGGFFTLLGTLGGTTAIGFFALLAPTLAIKAVIIAGGILGGVISYFWSINYWKEKPKDKKNVYFFRLLASWMTSFLLLLFMQELISDALAEKYDIIAEIREFFMRAMSLYYGLYFVFSFVSFFLLVSAAVVLPAMENGKRKIGRIT